MRAILFRNGEEIKRAPYPRKDMGVIPDLLEGLEWKLIVNNPIPSFDARTHFILSNEVNTNTPHPDYPHLKQYVINYTKQQKVNAQIEQVFEQLEQESNEQILKENKRLKYTILGLGILIRKSNGISITAKEEIILDRILTKATNVWHNDATLKDKIDQLTLGSLPDLDTDWNTEE